MDEAEQRWRFRARPLRVDDGVPVLYFTKRLKNEEKELYSWLLSSEGQAQVGDLVLGELGGHKAPGDVKGLQLSDLFFLGGGGGMN